MSANDLIHDEDFDGLPDDAEQRLAALLRKVRPRFVNQISQMEENRATDRQIVLAYHDFQSAIASCAAGWEIEYSSAFEPKPLSAYTVADAVQFMAMLTGFVSKQRAISEHQSRRHLIRLSDSDKISMRRKVSDLRNEIEQSGLNDKRRAKLHKFLDDFEQELDKAKPDYRILVGAVMIVVTTLADIGGAKTLLVESSDWLTKTLLEAQDDWQPAESAPPRQITYQPESSGQTHPIG